MNWVTSVGSVAIFVAPFTTGCSGWLAALWTGLIMGMMLASLSYMKNLKWAAVAGLITLVAPWLLGFSGISAAL